MAECVLLYVEDDDAAFFLFELAVREADQAIRLFRATNGNEALTFLRRLAPFQQAPRPNLILLDLNLPAKSGTEVLAELKADESLRSIPVVIFSSSSLAADKERSLNLGAEDYITKPSSFERFVEAIKNVLAMEW